MRASYAGRTDDRIPGGGKACWKTTRHGYTNLKTRRGTYVRNDNFACNR